MPEEFSPEEKLLRLIRGEKKQRPIPVPEGVKGPVAAASAPEVRPPAAASQKHRRRTMPIARREGDRLKVVNVTLAIFLSAAVLFLIFDLIYSRIKPEVSIVSADAEIKKDEVISSAPAAREQLPPAQVTPFSSYQEVVGRRELFKPLRTEPQEGKTPKRKAASAYDKLKDFSLIGIISGEKPQAVIEDKKMQKTFFIYEGQEISEMRLEKILGDRVILEFEGDKVELVL